MNFPATCQSFGLIIILYSLGIVLWQHNYLSSQYAVIESLLLTTKDAYFSGQSIFSSVLVDPRGEFGDMPFNTATTDTATTTTYHSDYPSLSIQLGSLPTARGGGILTVQSGCRMSRWIFHGRECKWSSPQPQVSQYLQNGSQLKENAPFTFLSLKLNDLLMYT